MERVDVGLGLEGTHCLVTGGAGMIGSHVVSAFLSAGARVTCLDISASAINSLLKSLQATQPEAEQNLHTAVVDITDEPGLENVFATAMERFGLIQCCVALASLDLSVLDHHSSVCDMPASQWKRTHEVNVFGTFLTARTWARCLRSKASANLRNISLIIVGSESGLFGERGNADYSSAKSAVQGGLLQSLKMDIPRICPGARVNAIAPGPVDTPQFKKECAQNPKQYWHDAEATVGLGRPVPMAAVARSIVFLASENFSGSVHGQILAVDSGKLGKLVHEEGEAAQFR